MLISSNPRILANDDNVAQTRDIMDLAPKLLDNPFMSIILFNPKIALKTT